MRYAHMPNRPTRIRVFGGNFWRTESLAGCKWILGVDGVEGWIYFCSQRGKSVELQEKQFTNFWDKILLQWEVGSVFFRMIVRSWWERAFLDLQT